MRVLNHVQLFETPWTVAFQAPLSVEFSRQEYWSGLPFPPPGDLYHPGIKPASPASPALASPLAPPGKPISIQKASYKLGIMVAFREKKKKNWENKDNLGWN